MSPTTFNFLFIPFLAIVLLAVNLIFAPHNPYQEKDSAFECGFHSFLGQNRTQFSISFFIFALLFLLFDLEILLVYPYVVSAYTNGIYGLVIMLIFFLALTLGFAFELGKNALKIESRQTIINNNSNLSNNTYLNGMLPYKHLIVLNSSIFTSLYALYTKYKNTIKIKIIIASIIFILKIYFNTTDYTFIGIYLAMFNPLTIKEALLFGLLSIVLNYILSRSNNSLNFVLARSFICSVLAAIKLFIINGGIIMTYLTMCHILNTHLSYAELFGWITVISISTIILDKIWEYILVCIDYILYPFKAILRNISRIITMCYSFKDFNFFKIKMGDNVEKGKPLKKKTFFNRDGDSDNENKRPKPTRNNTSNGGEDSSDSNSDNSKKKKPPVKKVDRRPEDSFEHISRKRLHTQLEKDKAAEIEKVNKHNLNIIHGDFDSWKKKKLTGTQNENRFVYNEPLAQIPLTKEQAEKIRQDDLKKRDIEAKAKWAEKKQDIFKKGEIARKEELAKINAEATAKARKVLEERIRVEAEKETDINSSNNQGSSSNTFTAINSQSADQINNTNNTSNTNNTNSGYDSEVDNIYDASTDDEKLEARRKRQKK